MPVPVALLASLIPLLKKAPQAMKTAMKSKHFITGLISAGFLGQTALTQAGKSGDRKVAKEELELRKLLGLNQADVTKRMTEESRANTQKYTETLLKARKEDKKEAREAELMESFTGSQDRQTAMLMQAVSGVAQARPTAPRASSGMVGLMRGA